MPHKSPARQMNMSFRVAILHSHSAAISGRGISAYPAFVAKAPSLFPSRWILDLPTPCGAALSWPRSFILLVCGARRLFYCTHSGLYEFVHHAAAGANHRASYIHTSQLTPIFAQMEPIPVCLACKRAN